MAFESSATNLVANDANGVRDIFVRDRTTSVTTRISVSSTGSESSNVSFGAAISGNGERVVFTSSEILVPADKNGLPDIYGRPVGAGSTNNSVAPGGVEANGGSGGAAISADGTLVAFTTNAPNLSALDTNFGDDVYVRDRATGAVRLASVPSGTTAFRAFDATLSGNGRTIAFSKEPIGGAITAAQQGAGAAGLRRLSTDWHRAAVDWTFGSESVADARRGRRPRPQISGSGLAGSTKVFFGATPGTGLSVVNDETVLVTVPAHVAGSVEVGVESRAFRTIASASSRIRRRRRPRVRLRCSRTPPPICPGRWPRPR